MIDPLPKYSMLGILLIVLHFLRSFMFTGITTVMQIIVLRIAAVVTSII